MNGKDEDDGGQNGSLIVEETPEVIEEHAEVVEETPEVIEQHNEPEKPHLRERIVNIAREKKILMPGQMPKEAMLVRLLIAFVMLAGLIILFVVLGKMKVDGGAKSQ